MGTKGPISSLLPIIVLLSMLIVGLSQGATVEDCNAKRLTKLIQETKEVLLVLWGINIQAFVNIFFLYCRILWKTGKNHVSAA